MPRTTLTQAQRTAQRWTANDQALVSAVLAKLTMRGMTRKQLADAINISAPTMTRKLRTPADFTLKELRSIAKALDFSDAECSRIV